MKARLPLTPREADRVLLRMMLTGAPEPPFQPVFEAGHYRVYRRLSVLPPDRVMP